MPSREDARKTAPAQVRAENRTPAERIGERRTLDGERPTVKAKSKPLTVESYFSMDRQEGAGEAKQQENLRFNLRPCAVVSEIDRRRCVGRLTDRPNFVGLADHRLRPF
jgi:hypothetical protein